MYVRRKRQISTQTELRFSIVCRFIYTQCTIVNVKRVTIYHRLRLINQIKLTDMQVLTFSYLHIHVKQFWRASCQIIRICDRNKIQVLVRNTTVRVFDVYKMQTKTKILVADIKQHVFDPHKIQWGMSYYISPSDHGTYVWSSQNANKLQLKQIGKINMYSETCP